VKFLLATVALVVSLPATICMAESGEDPAAAARTLGDGVYAKQQARAGKKLYNRHCISCHERGYFRQVLATRQGQTLAELFNVMIALMPQNAPGTLEDTDYVAVLAYMLQDARYRPGEQPLTKADLAAIVISGAGQVEQGL